MTLEKYVRMCRLFKKILLLCRLDKPVEEELREFEILYESATPEDRENFEKFMDELNGSRVCTTERTV